MSTEPYVWKDANFAGCKATMLAEVDDYRDIKWENCPGNPFHQISSFYSNYTGDNTLTFDTHTFDPNHPSPEQYHAAYCVKVGTWGNVPKQYNDSFESHAVFQPNDDRLRCDQRG